MSTTTKNRPTMTAEQRRERAAALQASIAEQVEQLRDSGRWARFLRFMTSFHHYSLNNLLLIAAQMPEATCVAGFRQWQERGRQVRKGEHGIAIFGYSQKTIEPEEDDQEAYVRRFFPVRFVFDISQTDPIDPAADPIDSVIRPMVGEDHFGVVDAVTAYLAGLGWTLTRAPVPGSANGYTTADGTHQVVIDSNLAPAQAARTALHEAAHVLLHTEQDYSQYVDHRGLAETEAESVAYVVAGVLGMDTAAYSIGYVTNWSDGDTDLVRETATNVLTAAHQLIAALTGGREEARGRRPVPNRAPPALPSRPNHQQRQKGHSK